MSTWKEWLLIKTMRLFRINPKVECPVPVGVFSKRIKGDNLSVYCECYYPLEKHAVVDTAAKPEKRFYTRSENVHKGIAHFSSIPPAVLSGLSEAPHCANNFCHLKPQYAEDLSYPVVVFSHGLGGCADIYSLVCSELAGQGFIVLVLEHADGSGAFAVTHQGEELFYDHPPADMKYTRTNVVNFRSRFLNHRYEELSLVLNSLSTLKQESSEGNDTYSVQSQVFRAMNIDEVILAGHSFGACSTVNSYTKLEKRENIKALLLYDLWPFPLPVQIQEQPQIIDVPCLSLLSPGFVFNPEQVITSALAANNRLFYNTYITGTKHSSFSDAPFWFPEFIGRKANLTGKRERRETLDIIIKLSDFFCKNYRDITSIEQVLSFARESFKAIAEPVLVPVTTTTNEKEEGLSKI